MSRDPVCLTFRKILLASIFGVGVFLIPNGVQSAASNSASLQWAANSEPDLAGYRVHHGIVPKNYPNSKNVGKVTSYQFTNLVSNTIHYFTVTAFDKSGNESSPSIEVSKPIVDAGSLLSVSIKGEGTVTSNPSGFVMFERNMLRNIFFRNKCHALCSPRQWKNIFGLGWILPGNE